MSISGSLITDCASVVKSAELIPSRADLISRTAIFFKINFAPARVESSALFFSSSAATWLPTTPQPSMPI